MPRLIIMPRRREPEDYVYDIEKIAENVRRKDPGIEVIVHWAETEALSAGIPKASLIVCLRQLDAPLAVPGRVMACAAISKVDQERAYRNNWIPTPPAVPFQWGLALDPKQWGAFVVIKPLSPDLTSFGGALWCPTTLLPNLRPEHFAPNHPSRDNAFLVQSFIDTGRYPRHYRVLCFLGVPLHAMAVTLKVPRPRMTSNIAEILKANIATNGGAPRDRELISDPDILAFARQISNALPNVPLQGIDILREHKTGKLYALESNPGGNTWHFASSYGEIVRKELVNGREKMLAQFNALQLAADALINATRAYAK